MVKIKTKKTMSLPQLIEWGFENDVTNTWYRASNVEDELNALNLIREKLEDTEDE